MRRITEAIPKKGTGGELAAAMQRNATAPIVNVARVICARLYHLVIAV
jgi:hypothetical protein